MGKELKVAMKAAKAAGKIIMKYYGTELKIDFKKGKEVVTQA